MQRYIHREMRLFEDAIAGHGMTYHPARQRWAIPPKVGVSRILDEPMFEPSGGGDDDDDDTPGPGSATTATATKKKGGGGTKGKGRKSTKGKAAAGAATMAEALDMDLDEDADAEAVADEEGDGDGEEGQAAGQLAELPRPTRVSPYWAAMYGQYMLAAGSHHGALCALRPTPA